MWCHDNFLNARNLQYAREVRAQLLEICERCDIEPTSCGSNLDQVKKKTFFFYKIFFYNWFLYSTGP